MAFQRLGSLGEVAPGSVVEMMVGDRPLAVCRVNGEIHVIEGTCPHVGGPLGHGALHGTTVVCPWHAWEYDIRTGQSWFDPAHVRVRQYEVAVEMGGAVAAEAPPMAPGVTAIEGAGTRTSGQSALRKGPYVAETYPVSLDQHYVVVEIDA